MATAKTYSLWLRPLGDTAYRLRQRIEALAEKHGTPVFEPHVTLIGGLENGETELKQLTDTLVAGLEPFEIELYKAGYRNTFYQSLFIKAKKSDALMNARRMAQQLFGKEVDVDYTPHLSLMYGDFTQEEKEKMLNNIGREFDITFRVHGLVLVDTTGKPKEWRKIHSADFESS